MAQLAKREDGSLVGLLAVATNQFLVGTEIGRCPHRIALSRGGPQEQNLVLTNPSLDRRRREAERSKSEIVGQIIASHGDVVAPVNVMETLEALERGVEVLISPILPDDLKNQRRTHLDALVRVGRVDDRFRYAPILIRNIEVVEVSSTRRIRAGDAQALRPNSAAWENGLVQRRTDSVVRSLLGLSHGYRHLETLNVQDQSADGGIFDRNGRLWWVDLQTPGVDWNLQRYDALHLERLDVLRQRDTWEAGGGEYPTSPYWHRECDQCPYSNSCYETLSQHDDVSLVRFTRFSDQVLLREAGIRTRRDLAQLDPRAVVRARDSILSATAPQDPIHLLSKQVSNLDELIYKARSSIRGSILRKVDISELHCPTADVEVDVDMESYNDRTYLWGATVSTSPAAHDLVATGYRAFVSWDTLTPDVETSVFADFWSWFSGLQEFCRAQGLTFAAYCFYAQAENSSMRRAISNNPSQTPDAATVNQFLASTAWVDLHEIAKSQLQTEGPLGLKVLAASAGFKWRDQSPSGEESMVWYEFATGADLRAAEENRARLLAYNEDDCLATRALREWINSIARDLPHRDEPIPQ